jgi:hypothetical protein
MGKSYSNTISDNLAGILGIVIGLALLPVVMYAINEAKAIKTVAANASVSLLLDIVPLIYIFGIVVGAIVSFVPKKTA